MSRSENELAGEVAIVTGAARNIGRATCLSLAAAGAAVCVNAMTSGDEAEALAQKIEAAGGKAMHYIVDVTDPDAVSSMAEAVAARFGKLSILVNNAAVRGNTPLNELTLEEWRRIFNPIVEGSMLCTQAALPHIRAAGGGTVILLGGIASYVVVAGRTHVGAAKAALGGFMKGLVHEVGSDNIRVNTVVPGHIDTVRGAAAGRAAELRYDLRSRPAGPAGRGGGDDPVLVRAGRYVTGQTIHVSGGVYMPG